MQILAAYFVTAIVFLGLDLVWLGFVARDFYRAQMAHLIAPEFVVAPALAFYVLYIVGVTYFATGPALRSGNWQDAIVPAALFGLVAYATYDLTNWAVLRDWPAKLALIDMAWGMALTALASSVGAFVALRLK